MGLERSRSSPRKGAGGLVALLGRGRLLSREHWASWITACCADTKGQRQCEHPLGSLKAWVDC